jgi:hypothetical protein
MRDQEAADDAAVNGHVEVVAAVHDQALRACAPT